MKKIQQDVLVVLKLGGQQLQELGQVILDDGKEGAMEAYEVITLASGTLSQMQSVFQQQAMTKDRFESNVKVIESMLRKKLKTIKNEQYHLAVQNIFQVSLDFLKTTVLGVAKTYLPIPS